jgi:hypothetical protein
MNYLFKIKKLDLEYLVFLLIILYSLIIRLYKLSTIPPVINRDEAGSIIQPLQIITHNYKSIFTLTHDNSVSYIVYLFKTLSVYIFGTGNALFAVRLTTAMVSVLTLIPFYQILRSYVNKSIALLTTFAFSSNYWFLNFSRLSWICVDTLLPGLLLLIYTKKAVKKPILKYYIIVAILSAIMLYSYMGGRIFFLASLIFLFTNLFTSRKVEFKRKLKYFLIYLISTFLIFLPQLVVIFRNTNLYLLRARSVYIFNINSFYYGILPNKRVEILKHQFSFAVRGFVFLDNRVAAEGVENKRLVPNNSSGVNNLIKILFWLGIILLFIRKRGDYIWFIVYILNIILLQIPTVFIPSWSRAIGTIPIIYFFVAITLQEVQISINLSRFKQKMLFYFLISLLLITASLSDLKRYWIWVNSPIFYAAQQPAIDVSKVKPWLSTQLLRLSNNQPVLNNYEWNAIKNNNYAY